MNSPARQKHWEHIYETKEQEEVSWYQPRPETSLQFIQSFNLPKDAPIIDVGGGDSFLVDSLLELGYTDLTVLDISSKALKRAQQRLGTQASKVEWIVSDVTQLQVEKEYFLWHDRAVFHFLTTPEDQQRYVSNAASSMAAEGSLLIGTFSDQGPTRCSGIDIQQYSERSLAACFSQAFQMTFSERLLHQTPFDTTQEFLFAGFKPL